MAVDGASPNATDGTSPNAGGRASPDATDESDQEPMFQGCSDEEAAKRAEATLLAGRLAAWLVEYNNII